MPSLLAVAAMLACIMIAFVGRNIWDAVSIYRCHGMPFGPLYSITQEVVQCGPFSSQILIKCQQR